MARRRDENALVPVSDSDSDSDEEFTEIKKQFLDGNMSDDEDLRPVDEEGEGGSDADSLNSEDSDFMAKLRKKMQGGGDEDGEEEDGESESSSDNDDDNDDDDSDSDSDMSDEQVGFSFGDSNSNGGSSNKSSIKKADADSDSESDSSESEDDSDHNKNNKTRQKNVIKKKEEAAIALREQQLADGTADANPEAADFERLLLESPNSSELYIRYMAYHMGLSDIDSARKVAERGVKKINVRNEEDKLNVFVAWLTLELKYGEDEKVFEGVIKKGSESCNPKHVHLRAAEQLEKLAGEHGYGKSGKEKGKGKGKGKGKKLGKADAAVCERADAFFATMCKKFKSKKSVWLAYLRFKLVGGNSDEALEVMKRSMLSLPEYKHVEVVGKVAGMEFELGSMERGRTLYDGLLLKNKKRFDLFNMYLDKEVKWGGMESGRRLFERIVKDNMDKKLKFNDKKMKGLFQKMFKLESEHGTEETKMAVQKLAGEYVEGS